MTIWRRIWVSFLLGTSHSRTRSQTRFGCWVFRKAMIIGSGYLREPLGWIGEVQYDRYGLNLRLERPNTTR